MEWTGQTEQEADAVEIVSSLEGVRSFDAVEIVSSLEVERSWLAKLNRARRGGDRFIIGGRAEFVGQTGYRQGADAVEIVSSLEEDQSWLVKWSN